MEKNQLAFFAGTPDHSETTQNKQFGLQQRKPSARPRITKDEKEEEGTAGGAKGDQHGEGYPCLVGCDYR